MNFTSGTRLALPLVVAAGCLFEYILNRQISLVQEWEISIISLQWMFFCSLALWCASFIRLSFRRLDLWLYFYLLIGITHFCIGEVHPAVDSLVFLFGIALGKGTQLLLEKANCKSEIRKFLTSLVGLLAFASWWHLDMANNYYHGPRWTGLWNNPNIYGMLMGVGVVLAVGLGVGNPKFKIQNSKAFWFLAIATGMMGVGLIMSYSRGAWLATTIGLLYLAWSCGKLKWRLVLPFMLATAAVVVFFWHSTADTDAWYLKRLDLSRPSAQHRVSAWRGAVQMMRDHPLGVGWNQAVDVYDKNYLPPEGGAAALTLNSYLMLGTELGLPGLLCFVAYVSLVLTEKRKAKSAGSCDSIAAGSGDDASSSGPAVSQTAPPIFSRDAGLAITLCDEASQLRCTCRAGALMFVTAFWFDGGLFTLATASVFWILLELGAARKVDGRE